MLNKCIFVAAVLCAAQPVLAGPIADKAVEIEALLAANNDSDSIEAASKLYDMAWQASAAIGFHQTVLVSQPITLMGVFNPRPDDKYKVGEGVLIYAEPFGYGFGQTEDGLYSIDFAVDLKVMSEKGEVLAQMPDLTTLELTSRMKNHEFPANLTYTLNGIPPGRYVLETTLRDKNSAKVGSFQNTVEFVE
jgi:hypothetical protein